MNKSGTVYIGKCNVGKSTKLLDLFNQAYEEEKRILVIDSATEHKESSLLLKIQSNNNIKYTIISSFPCEKILFPKESDYLLPMQNIPYSQVYLCDAAYYLEKSYELPKGKKREMERALYIKFSMQVMEMLIDSVDVIIMDEIELIPSSYELIKMISEKKIELYMALHVEESLCGMQSLFNIIYLE